MNCSTAGLAPFVPLPGAPWDTSRVQHLYRRLGYGATLEEIAGSLALPPGEVVDALLDQAAARALPPAPDWADWDYARFEADGREPFEAYLELMDDFLDRGIAYGIREKLVLFWHDHFVTQYESHSCPAYHYHYFDVLTRNAFGNLRTFVREITLTPAMLVFLNGLENRKESPNENYARELFELFTLGENTGYTQEDVTEASRALTGWNGWVGYCTPLRYTPQGFDNGAKTIFGKTGNYDVGGLIDLLFAERGEAISRFICRKLYRYFVNPEPDEAVVDQLATTFRDQDYEILPVLRQLFQSAHFFDDAHRGVQVKGPVELMTSFLRQGAFGDFENRRRWGFWGIATLGQQPGEPPDVAGWPGNRAWIDSNRLTLRWEFMDGFAWAVHNHNERTYPDWAIALTANSNDPAEVTRAIADFFLPRGLPDEAAYALATAVFRWEVPANYYANKQWSLAWGSASWQITLLLRHLARQPEFQLT